MARSAYTPFTFGDVNSADYEVYVSSVAYLNTPARDYEYSEVPGRNGDLIIDNRRFKNIDVKYNCYCRDISKFDAWKEAVLQQEGYVKLSCDVLSSETYRMASLSNAIEVPTFDHKGASFSVTFNCKPQRFLYTGDEYGETYESRAASIITGTRTNNLFPDDDTLRDLFENYYGYHPSGVELYEIDISTLSVDVFTVYRKNSESNGFPFALWDSDSRISLLYGSSNNSATVIDKSNVTADKLLLPSGEYFEITSQGTVLLMPLTGADEFTLTNPTKYNAYPLLRVTNLDKVLGYPQIIINDAMIQIDVPYISTYYDYTVNATTVYIDCSSMTAYAPINGDENNLGSLGSYVTISGDPALKPGDNKILLNGGVENFSIMPRWWII